MKYTSTILSFDCSIGFTSEAKAFTSLSLNKKDMIK